MRHDPTPGQARILVVDDQEANVTLLRRILERAGYAAVTAFTDPRLVPPSVERDPPDLVLLDLHMPHLDGYAVLAALAATREGEGFLPVLILTADADPGARRRALEAGATDFVTKPFDADEVLLRCRNLLQTRALYRELAERSRRVTDELVMRTGELESARTTHDLVLKALDRLHDGATLETRAAALADELGRTSEFDSISILGIDPDGSATPLAATESSPFRGSIGRPIPDWLAEMLSARLRSGAGAGPIEMDDPRLAELVARGGTRSFWFAPITENEATVGVLTAGSQAEPTAEVLAARLPLVSEFGAIARALLGADLAARHAEAGTRRRLESVLADRSFRPVFQPVVDIRDRRVIGLEALTRFADGARPDLRFAEAHRVGLGLRLEEETLVAALAAADALPHSAWLSVNASPDLLLAEGRLARALAGSRRMVVVEITEHVAIGNYARLREALRSLGPNVRIAIDDAGAGFASFRHVLELEPDFVKLDADLIRGIEGDASRQALVVGMRYFAQKTGCTLIAEGIETEAERAMLEVLDIRFGQGYLLGRPAPAAELTVGALA